MSKYGGYIAGAKGVMDLVGGVKPHSSISDWIEILTSDRYEEDSLDGINEVLESIRLQGFEGITESSRAIRKKLKYGNVHRQLRSLTILRALSENGSNTYKHSFANDQLMQRFREMATDSLIDPKVKRKLIAVFHAWYLAFGDDPRNKALADLWPQYSGKTVRKPAAPNTSSAPRGSNADTYFGGSTTKPTTTGGTSTPTRKTTQTSFEDLDHSWVPTKGHATSASDYSDLAIKKEEAAARAREREQRSALEMREAEIERRERALKVKEEEKRKAEEYRVKLAEEERKRKEQREKERLEKERLARQPKRPPFNFEKEKPQILIGIANASQAATSLVNACRHVNRQEESLLENLRVQDALENAKVVRRPIIRYIQLVTDDVVLGTLLEANEQIVQAIQLYDKMCKPADLDSDSDSETAQAKAASARDARDKEEASARKRAEAQRLEEQRTGELWKMQQRQKYESDKQSKRREQGKKSYYDERDRGGRSEGSRLPPPLTPDDVANDRYGNLSDFSDYDSSDDDYRARRAGGSRSQPQSRRGSQAAYKAPSKPIVDYNQLSDDEDDEDEPRRGGQGGRTLDPYDPFADPTDFLGSIGGGSGKPKQRQEWAAI